MRWTSPELNFDPDLADLILRLCGCAAELSDFQALFKQRRVLGGGGLTMRIRIAEDNLGHLCYLIKQHLTDDLMRELVYRELRLSHLPEIAAFAQELKATIDREQPA